MDLRRFACGYLFSVATHDVYVGVVVVMEDSKHNFGYPTIHFFSPISSRTRMSIFLVFSGRRSQVWTLQNDCSAGTSFYYSISNKKVLTIIVVAANSHPFTLLLL